MAEGPPVASGRETRDSPSGRARNSPPDSTFLQLRFGPVSGEPGVPDVKKKLFQRKTVVLLTLVVAAGGDKKLALRVLLGTQEGD